MSLRAGMPEPARFFFGFAAGFATGTAPGTLAAVALTTGATGAAVAPDPAVCAMTGRRRLARWPGSWESNREAGRRGAPRDFCCSPDLRSARDWDCPASVPLV